MKRERLAGAPRASEGSAVNERSGSSFRIASWNVLADSLLQSNRELYARDDSSTLLEHVRQPQRLWLIGQLKADILGLQEVERFEQSLASSMARVGYRGIYKQRTGGQKDGVAIFFRESRFELVYEEALEFRVLADGCASHEEADRMRKHNVALLVVLRDRWNAGRELLVSCCHLLWNPRRGLVKLRQMQYLMARVAELQSRGGGRMPVVLVGDWNCTPHSPLYAFLCRGQFTQPLHTEGKWDGQQAAKAVQHSPSWAPIRGGPGVRAGRGHGGGQGADGYGSLIQAANPLVLESAYAAQGEPRCTTFHRGFQGTVDYILIDPTRLRSLGVMPTPPPELLAQYGSLPDCITPSDHVPIAVDLAWVDAPAASPMAGLVGGPIHPPTHPFIHPNPHTCNQPW